MEMCLANGEYFPQLLDLIPKDREEWLIRGNAETKRPTAASEETKLELRLGPPGEDCENGGRGGDSDSSTGYLSNAMGSSKRVPVGKFERNTNGSKSQKLSSKENSAGAVDSSPFVQLPTNAQSLSVMTESSQPCCTNLVVELQAAEERAFSPPFATTAVPNGYEKRIAPSPVVGWPPIRSFRKNLASNGTPKRSLDSQNVIPRKVAMGKPEESCRKVSFVKINMDGIPIGRKVDLKAYDSYDQLCSAVDELFRGLLAAQRGSDETAITGLLDGSGEYTFVYEDNEGDRILVGDVPWHMFVSTAKRLRVLKSSEISALSLGSNKNEKTRLLSGMK